MEPIFRYCWNCGALAQVIIALDGNVIIHEPACMTCAAPLIHNCMAEVVEVL